MTRYEKGRAFEYRVKKFFEEKGFYVVRSAGSHSLFDLILFGVGGFVLPIQLSYKFEREKEKELMNFAERRRIAVGYLVFKESLKVYPSGLEIKQNDIKEKSMFEICRIIQDNTRQYFKAKIFQKEKRGAEKW